MGKRGSPQISETEPGGRASLRTWLRLLACTNLIETRLQSRLRQKFGTTLARFDVLAQLDARETEDGSGLTMTELSRRLMVTNGNLTGLIERLLAERLVARSVPASERRSQIVRLTPEGKRAFQRMVPQHRAWVERMFSGISPEENKQFHELIGKLKHSVQKAWSEENAG